MSKFSRYCLAFSIIPQALLVHILSQHPDVVETYYSTGFYPIVSKLFRYMFGWIPFSVGDVLMALALVYVLRWGIIHFRRLFKPLNAVVITSLTTLSIIYFMFHLLWGLNYYRLPLNERLNLEVDYTTESLNRTTKKLVNLSNAIHLSITKDSNAVVDIPYNFKTLGDKISEGYNLTSMSYPFLEYNPSSQKQSLFSGPQAYMGFSGYLNPLTNEAQVNYNTPANSLPLTLAHEQAHQLGYAAENEANFIAFLSTQNHPDPLIRYAAHTFALKYCMNELFRRSPTDFEQIRSTIHSGILEDFKNRREHWAQFQNPLEPYFKSGYNTYLKVNNQQAGIDSYNRVVALLVNFLKQ